MGLNWCSTVASKVPFSYYVVTALSCCAANKSPFTFVLYMLFASLVVLESFQPCVLGENPINKQVKAFDEDLGIDCLV